MARMARFLKEGISYYLQSKGCEDTLVFKDALDYERYIDLLKKFKVRFHVEIYGYCLMAASVHLVARPRRAVDLPRFMQGISQAYALFVNRRYARTGKVWAQRYKSQPLLRAFDLLECVKAVEFIPVTHGRAPSPAQYAWSSCAQRVLGKEDRIIDLRDPGDREDEGMALERLDGNGNDVFPHSRYCAI